MSSDEVGALIAEGVVERVQADVAAARRDLIAARTHLESAAAVAGIDPVGAFTLAYDGMRKAIVAHMRANGMRVKARTGAHYQTGRYAIAALGGEGIDSDLRAFNTLRALRNRSEYGGALVREADVTQAIAYADTVLKVIADEIGE